MFFVNETLARWIEKVGRRLRSLESRSSGTSRLVPEEWEGVIVDAGPNDEDDYTDHRYWVARARGANTSGDWTTAAKLETQPRLPAGTISLSVTNVRPRIVTATNLAEWSNPGSADAPTGSHTLPVGTPVRVRTITDAQPAHVQRYIFTATLSPALFWVLVEQTGGDAGDDAGPCTFVYTVKSLAGVELATGKTPERRRPPYGAMLSPDANSRGLAYYDSTGTLVLWDANEVIDTEAC